VEGMTGKNGWIIGFLAKHSGSPVYQKDLEKEFNVTRSTASKVITLMEKKGFVARRGVENDARLKEIVLTEKGRMLACRMQQDIMDMEEKLTAGFTWEEKEQLINYLMRIYCNLNENERNDKGGEKQ
ncbi:MAG: MarR family winged helix-turn-helix transcriptional regulator, partial [Anaerovoracaceae bacterium]